ncbi:hemolysin family protein [Thermodesulfobacteriota bacterium]
MDDIPDQGFLNRLKSLYKSFRLHGNSNDLTEEIQDLMDEGQAKGFISNEESHMVSGVLDLKETPAHSIMIPRTEIFSAPVNSTLGEIIKLVTHCGHTRIPMYNDNIDEILGILHAKDLLKLLGKDPGSKIPHEILRRPYFIPDTKKISDVLRELKEKKTHLAIVTDEYGGTAGIITLEDIIEEIVGEIMDEHDHEEALLTVRDDGSLLVDARLDVEKLEEYLDVKLPKGAYESVGGFIIHLTGSIPGVEEKINFENFEITVQKADPRKIDKVIISRKTAPGPSDEENIPV